MKLSRTPFFSVIIPTYNSAATLTACLTSIIQQSFKDFEVWIIDNNSSDGTKEIAEKFRPFGDINFHSEEDKGIFDAMNKGTEWADGSYFYFLGSDDSFYGPDVLQSVYNDIGASGAEIIYGNVIMHGSNQWVNNGTIHAGEFDLKRLLSHNICHQSIFYNRGVFKKVGNYNLKYPVFADFDLNLRCAASYQLRYLDLIIANFHVGGASTQLTDAGFERDRYANIIRYFLGKLHGGTFVDLRLYVQRAALSKDNDLGLLLRVYCLLVYTKLKLQSLIS